jgi:hypothetical protein
VKAIEHSRQLGAPINDGFNSRKNAFRGAPLDIFQKWQSCYILHNQDQFIVVREKIVDLGKFTFASHLLEHFSFVAQSVPSKRWQPQLTTLLGFKAHLDLYNDPDGDKVRRYCDEYSVLLFPLKRTPLQRG